MILSDRTIRKMLSEQTLTIHPLEERQIQPRQRRHSPGRYILAWWRTHSSGIITMEHEIHYKTLHTDRYLLLPGQFVLATTIEYIAPARQPDRVCGRAQSALAAWGCSSKMRAGWTPGLKGRSRWNCSMPTGAPSSCVPAGALGNWCLHRWTLLPKTRMQASTSGKGRDGIACLFRRRDAVANE